MQEMHETLARSLGQEDPLEEKMAIHSSILGESHGQRSLVGYSPKGCKESDTTEATCTVAKASTGRDLYIILILISNI